MRKSLFVLVIVVALTVATAATAYAGGDQVRGDKGQGEVVQVQVQDPPPFQP